MSVGTRIVVVVCLAVLGTVQTYRNGVYFNDQGEPGWLIFLRIVVFGFIPFAMIAASFSEGSFSISDFFILLWFLPFVPCLPTLFILEVIYLRRVLQKPELQARFGDRAYHILSLSAYAIAATAVCVVWTLWEIT